MHCDSSGCALPWCVVPCVVHRAMALPCVLCRAMVLLCRAVPRCVAWRRVPGQALPGLLGLAPAALGAGLEGTRLGGSGGGTQCVRGQEEYGGAVGGLCRAEGALYGGWEIGLLGVCTGEVWGGCDMWGGEVWGCGVWVREG